MLCILFLLAFDLSTTGERLQGGATRMNEAKSKAYIDAVAQAVIDRIEERARVSTLVEAVVRRVLELQEETAKARGTSAVSETEDGICADTTNPPAGTNTGRNTQSEN